MIVHCKSFINPHYVYYLASLRSIVFWPSAKCEGKGSGGYAITQSQSIAAFAGGKRCISDFECFLFYADGGLASLAEFCVVQLWKFHAAFRIPLISKLVDESRPEGASPVMDALMMAAWRRGEADALLHHSDQ